ncbi:MAG: hypothetical protein IH602_14985 [Bryobacteraceae bacterium]|nr:hypothetical protein [Bryobacteraceae bacterium]
MYRVLTAIILTCLMGGLVFAQGTQVATVSSSQPFTMNGAAINPAGVPSWPVMAGAEIVAGSAPVTLTFPDGSRISLAPGSKARIESQNGKPVFRLQEGEAAYDLRSAESVILFALDKNVAVSGLRNTYSIGGAKKAGAFWTGRNMALVFGGAAAAAVGIGVAAISPSR